MILQSCSWWAGANSACQIQDTEWKHAWVAEGGRCVSALLLVAFGRMLLGRLTRRQVIETRKVTDQLCYAIDCSICLLSPGVCSRLLQRVRSPMMRLHGTAHLQNNRLCHHLIEYRQWVGAAGATRRIRLFSQWSYPTINCFCQPFMACPELWRRLFVGRTTGRKAFVTYAAAIQSG